MFAKKHPILNAILITAIIISSIFFVDRVMGESPEELKYICFGIFTLGLLKAYGLIFKADEKNK